VAVAPAGLAQRSDAHLQRVAFIEDPSDSSARDTATALANALGAGVVSASQPAELLVAGSRPESEQGRVGISAASMRLIDDASLSVLVVPRGVTIAFGSPVSVG
jgi:hypothetical protein